MAKDGTKIVVITGTTRGLGRAMVEEFIARGHTVIGCGRSQDQIAKLHKTFGKSHHFDALDVTSDEAVKQWAQSTLKTCDAPDLLVNNAALINRNARLWEVPADEFSNVI